MPAKIAVIYYSMYGHIKTLAKEIVAGIKETGCEVTLFQIPETLPDTLLKQLHAMPFDDSIPVIKVEDLTKFDGFLFGIPTRYGMAASQVKAFMDSTGALFGSGALTNKTAGVFVSTGSQGGGQETTALTFYTQFAHLGMIIVPMGFISPRIGDFSEVHGGSLYGPGTFAGSDGSRQVTELEKEIAQAYGGRFAKVTASFFKGNL